MDDDELLGRYAQEQDQQAFSTLVDRHGAWVYAAARRQVRDEHAAEDVAQAVFAMLARRAGKLKGYGHLGGWLFRAMSNCVVHVQRERGRRSRREAEAARMRSEVTSMDAGWEEIAPELEAAVGKLGRADRDAVLLRFYERKSLAEVGISLGLSEEAARKRVERAVGMLRGMLEKKGVTGTTAGLSAVLVANVVGQMPERLLQKVMAGIGGGAGNGTAGLIAKGAEKMMVMAKVKVAAVCVLCAVAMAIGGVVMAQMRSATTGPSRLLGESVEVGSKGSVTMKHQTLKGRDYVFRRLQTTQADMDGRIGQQLEEISAAMLEAKVQAVGGPLFIYNKASGDPSALFQVDIGYMVPDNTPAVGGLQVRRLAPFACITTLHSGRVHDVARTQAQLQESASTGGISLSGETREYYLYWEGASENSLILVAAGVRE